VTCNLENKSPVATKIFRFTLLTNIATKGMGCKGSTRGKTGFVLRWAGEEEEEEEETIFPGRPQDERQGGSPLRSTAMRGAERITQKRSTTATLPPGCSRTASVG